MSHIRKLSLNRIVARRSGAQWRENLVDKSADLKQPAAPIVWSRHWLRRRLGDTADVHGDTANHG